MALLKFSLQKKVLIAVLIPTSAYLFLAIQALSNQYMLVGQLERVGKYLEGRSSVDELLHRLYRERGITSVSLATEFDGAFYRTRSEVDEQLDHAEETQREYRVRGHRVDFDTVRATLSYVRNRIDQKRCSAEEAMRLYDPILILLSEPLSAAELSSIPSDIVVQLNTVDLLSEYQNYLGMERIAVTLKATPESLDRISDFGSIVSAGRSIYAHLLQQNAPRKVLFTLRERAATPEVRLAYELIEGARHDTPSFPSVTSSKELFQTLSAPLDAVHACSQDLYQQLKDLVRSRKTIEQTKMLWNLVLFSLFSLAIIATLLSAFLPFSRHLKNLLQAIRLAGTGNLDVQVQESAHDEIGLIQKNFNNMIERLRQEKEQRATLRKKSEVQDGINAELKQKNLALDESRKAVEEYAHLLSHDLKEPLRHIYTSVEIALEDFRSQIPRDVVRRLERILQKGERMEKLIDGALTFRRIDHTGLVREMAALDDIVQSAIDLSTATNCTISVEGKLPTVLCDPLRTQEIFLNLISNSVKYNENTHKDVTIYWDSETFEFCVKDNGIGIPKEHHEDVFIMGKRIATHLPNTPGTGLGLAYVRKIVHQHGGTIRLESEPGRGTSVFFTLTPKAKIAPCLQESKPLPSPPPLAN